MLPGIAAAMMCAAFFNRGSVFDPFITSTGAAIVPKRALGILNSVITAVSYGSVCATAWSFRQIHGISRIMTTMAKRRANHVTHEVLHGASAVAAGEEAGELTCVSGTASLSGIVDVGRLVGHDLVDGENPAAAASSASAPPDDRPSRDADPPASLMRAAMSSTSRAGEYRLESPLSPRPRRS